MRKFVLIAALVLASATAQAAGARNLTLASGDDPAPVTVKRDDPAPAETPKYAERPSAVDTATEQPKTEAAKPMAEKTGQAAKVEKPRRRRELTEARVIYELHRHGIYW